MKNAIAVILVFFLVIGISSSCFARKLKSSRGYWNFDGIVEIISHKNDKIKVKIVVNNLSVDDSYKSGQCKNGMASCIVDWEVWHPDVGTLIGPFKTSFQNVCNKKSSKIIETKIVPQKYSALEVRFNITTPNGGHSFKKARTNWK